jgi:hypothetical protein
VVRFGFTDEFAEECGKHDLGQFAWMAELYDRDLIIRALSSKIDAIGSALQQSQSDLNSRLDLLEKRQRHQDCPTMAQLEAVLQEVGGPMLKIQSILETLLNYRLNKLRLVVMDHVRNIKDHWDPELLLKLSEQQIKFFCGNSDMFIANAEKHLLSFMNPKEGVSLVKELEIDILGTICGMDVDAEVKLLSTIGQSVIEHFCGKARERLEFLRRSSDDINYDALLFPNRVGNTPWDTVKGNEEESAKHEEMRKLEDRQKMERVRKDNVMRLRKRLKEVEDEQEQKEDERKRLYKQLKEVENDVTTLK